MEHLVENYERFLNLNHPDHIKRFHERLHDQPESARAEAVVFSFLKENTTDVKVEEHLVKGGVDFRCEKDGSEFVVEVTCLDRKSVTHASGLPDEAHKTGSGRHYSMITPLLRHKTSRKASQMSGYNCPTVLIITSEHSYASMLLGTSAASDLLTDETLIAIPSISLITELKDSVFFRHTKNGEKKGELESCRQSISAILLFSVSGASAFVVGLLHPDPAYKFPPQLLSSVPFIGMKEYPPKNGRIRTGWLNQNTRELRPYRFWYDKQFRDT